MIPTLKIDRNTGNTLKIQNQLEILNQTYFNGDQVQNVNLQAVNSFGFSSTYPYILLGSLGSDTCELRLVSSISGANTIITTVAPLLVHSQGEPITNINYNQVVIESAATETGSYTVLATVDIQFTKFETVYQHNAGLSTTFYRIRFLNSGATIYSEYSESVSSGSFGATTAGYLIKRARSQMGDTTGIDDTFMVEAINDARNIVNTDFGFGRVNEWRQQFEYPVQMLAGRNYVTLPTDIDFNETNRTVLNARYARQSVAANLPIQYVDKRRWNNLAYQNQYSTTTGIVAISATSLPLTSTGDFPASGTVFAATDGPTQSIITITYTGNNLATNTLTGVTGVTRALPADCQVWGYSTFAYPFFYTVYASRLWFDRPIPTSLQGKNLYIDYYKKIVDISYLNDEVPEHYRNIYINYLKFAIKKRRDNTLGTDDEDYKRFEGGIKAVLGNPYTGQSQIIIS